MTGILFILFPNYCFMSHCRLTRVDCDETFRFLELGFLLEPGRQPKTDKASILNDAVRMVTQLRDEVQKHKNLNDKLQEKINELKVWKGDLS